MGNAIMSFYSALIDLLGRCAPEMHVRFSMTTATSLIFLIRVLCKTQLDIISSSSSMQGKVKRSEFGPSCALWFRHSTWWASSASLQKCLWSIKVRQDDDPSDSCPLFIPAENCYSTLAIFQLALTLLERNFPFTPLLVCFSTLSFISSSDGSVTEPDMSACFCPDHKAPMVLFLERVYGIEDQNFLMHMLEVGFLPDLRAAASLDTVGKKNKKNHPEQLTVPIKCSHPPSVAAC